MSELEINLERLEALILAARAEDLGTVGDLTTLLLPADVRSAEGRWALRSRDVGQFCGKLVVPVLLEKFAPDIAVEWGQAKESWAVDAGEIVARLSGPVEQMLTLERTLLNFLQHLSGIATQTARLVAAIAGTRAKIYDTRKTTPGLRELEKYAVLCGGGLNLRMGLHDAVLIKDNHLAGVPTERLAARVFEMLNGLSHLPAKPAFVEVECDSLAQLDELLKVVGIDVILLDNFELDDMRAAVRRRDRAGLGERLALEASGKVTLSNVRTIAETGVDRISVGYITHSAPILDLGLDAL